MFEIHELRSNNALKIVFEIHDLGPGSHCWGPHSPLEIIFRKSNIKFPTFP